MYSIEDRARGFIVSQDREGRVSNFPLLTVSAVIIHLPVCERNFSMDNLVKLIAQLKKRVKSSDQSVIVAEVHSLEEKIWDGKTQLNLCP